MTNATATVLSVTDIADDGGKPLTDTDPQALEAAARTHLDATHARLAALAQRATEREQQLTDLAERQQAAIADVQRTAAAVETYPAHLATARARLLIAQSQPTRSAMQREIEALLAAQQEAVQEHQTAEAEAERMAAAVRQERERLTRQALEERAETAELQALVPALVAEIAAAHDAAGEVALSRLRGEHAELEAARSAAQAALDQATTALEGFGQQVRDRLRPYPAILERVKGSALLPRTPDQAERVVEAHLKVLEILETGPFAPHELSAGDVPLGKVLCIPATPATAMALSGYSGAADYWHGRQQLARAFLAAYRQRQNGAN